MVLNFLIYHISIKLEKNKIKSLYNVKCINLINGISKKILKFKKN